MNEEHWFNINFRNGGSKVLRTDYLCSCIRQAIERNGRPPLLRLYKYTKSKYADMMVNEGRIRVGSLVDYQDAEKHAGGILDEAEGTQTTHTRVGGGEAWTSENMPAPVRPIIGIAPGQEVYVRDMAFQTTYVANAYVYCLSSKYDESLLAEDQFKADAIVEIIDTAGFIAAVDAVMVEHGCSFFGAVECKYVGRVFEHGDRRALLSAVEVKDERYSNQAETRLVWRARDDKVDKPEIMVTNPRIRATCRRIY